MRVLVTGGAGFIGSHTVDALIEQGHDVRILDSLEAPVHVDHQPPAYLNPKAEFCFGNVCSPRDLWEALDGMDAVYHLAAYQDYLPHFSQFPWINTCSTALLYELLVQKKARPRVILASTQAVYGEGSYCCKYCGIVAPKPRVPHALDRQHWDVWCPRCGYEGILPRPCTEDFAQPHTPYGISKLAAEQLALSLGFRYDIRTEVLRYSIVQGPRQSFRNAYSGVLRSTVLQLLAGEYPVIYEDGDQLRDYIHIQDVVRANLLALTGLEPGEVYNVGGFSVSAWGEPKVSVRKYVELIREVLDLWETPEIARRYRLGDTRHVYSSTRKLEKHGWQPQHTLREIVEDYVAWVREQPELESYLPRAHAEMARLGVLRKVEAEL